MAPNGSVSMSSEATAWALPCLTRLAHSPSASPGAWTTGTPRCFRTSRQSLVWDEAAAGTEKGENLIACFPNHHRDLTPHAFLHSHLCLCAADGSNRLPLHASPAAGTQSRTSAFSRNPGDQRPTSPSYQRKLLHRRLSVKHKDRLYVMFQEGKRSEEETSQRAAKERETSQTSNQTVFLQHFGFSTELLHFKKMFLRLQNKSFRLHCVSSHFLHQTAADWSTF